jgi:hypothetical protein
VRSILHWVDKCGILSRLEKLSSELKDTGICLLHHVFLVFVALKLLFIFFLFSFFKFIHSVYVFR